MLCGIRRFIEMDHPARIRRYGLLRHLRYLLNWNVDRILIHMHAQLEVVPVLQPPQGYFFEEMNYKCPRSKQVWLDIINRSYEDAQETPDTLENHLHNHLFLSDVRVYFLRCGEHYVGTVSAGVFRDRPTFGGDARIAVLPQARGLGLGEVLISKAFADLRDRGIQRGESVITLYRHASIVLHSRMGFYPEFDLNKVVFSYQWRAWPARLIAARRVRKLLRR